MKIYVITNLLNGKKYVGQTTGSIDRRWSAHCNGSDGKSYNWHSLIYRSIEKYGKSAFSIETVQECSTIDELNQAEKEWISKLRSTVPNGYNILLGGDNHKWTNSARDKMSRIQRNRSKEWQNNLKEGMKKRGQDWKEKLSQAAKGRKATPGQLEGLKNGRKFGRNGMRGEKNPRSKITEEAVREIRKLYATGQHSQQQLSVLFGLGQSTISSIIHRKIWKDVS